MPIRPENRARYPKDWKAISLAARERAGNRCEGSPDFPDCRVANGAVGYREGGRWIQLGESVDAAGLAIDAAVEDGHRVTRIVLTVAHLDHTPENCDPANLRAWCQRCHLHYDRHHHAQTRAATSREGRAVGDLLENGERP
jgi:hypothetical protein